MERQEQRLDNRIFQPPAVNSLADIKRLLFDLDPRHSIVQSIPIASELTGEDESGQNIRYRVSATTDAQTKRSIIIKGFEFIKSRLTVEQRARNDIKPLLVNGRSMAPVIKSSLNARAWVDQLIERWFNATRDGLNMCWVVPEGRYLYNVLEHKLYRDKSTETARGDSRGAAAR